MKLDLSSFLASADKVYHFEGKLEDNESVYDISDLNLIFPIAYQGDIYHLKEELVLYLTIEYSYDTHCDRCLKPMIEIQSSQLEAHHFFHCNQREDRALIETFTLKDKQLPLDDLIFSQIITNRPLKVLCDEECRGLCPICGQDLNEGDCHCQEQEGPPSDSRFEKLLDLFNNEEV